jgi:hypothetical protein
MKLVHVAWDIDGTLLDACRFPGREDSILIRKLLESPGERVVLELVTDDPNLKGALIILAFGVVEFLLHFGYLKRYANCLGP